MSVSRVRENRTHGLTGGRWRGNQPDQRPTLLSDLFPEPAQIASFDKVMAELGYDPSDKGEDLTKASGVGNRAARAVIEFRHDDGSNQLNGYADTSGYQPVNSVDDLRDIDHWQPLRVADGHGGTVEQKFIAPHWGGVTPFALTSGDQLRPKKGPTLSRNPGKFKKQAQEVLRHSAELTEKQKVIAEHWADGPSSELPPGHWALFANEISARDGHDLDADVAMFFAMTNAVFDASIACWDSKRAFDYVRPVTAINELFRGQRSKPGAGRARVASRSSARTGVPTRRRPS
jgi:hypothetical protein